MTHTMVANVFPVSFVIQDQLLAITKGKSRRRDPRRWSHGIEPRTRALEQGTQIQRHRRRRPQVQHQQERRIYAARRPILRSEESLE